MTKIISFEGAIGAGKTSLANYFAHDLNCEKLLEKYEENPFLADFYKEADVIFETEMSFLLIHYSQIKDVIENAKSDFIMADFSIVKDLVYARMNLKNEELKVFGQTYDYVVRRIGLPYAIIYMDLSLNILRRRIFQRGRDYEINADPLYFKQYNDNVKAHFKSYEDVPIRFFDVDDLDLEPANDKLKQIRDALLEMMKAEV